MNAITKLDWERLALTADQVRNYGLTPIIKPDRRFKNGGAHEAVETEALSQRLIVQIVRDRLDALLPEPLDAVKAREEGGSVSACAPASGSRAFCIWLYAYPAFLT